MAGMKGVPAPVALLGSIPRDGPLVLSRLGIPFLLVADPREPPVAPLPHQAGTLVVPFKTDPLSVLRAPIPFELTAAISFNELGLLPAALLSEGRGLRGPSVTAVLKTRDKLLMRHALAGAGIAQPRFGRLGEGTAEALPFPLIVKPVLGAGSRGVERVDDPAALAGGAGDAEPRMWEEVLDGPEYSVEAVSLDGRHDVLGVTAKVTTGPPGFVEVEHLAPAPLPRPVELALRREACRCLDALGVGLGGSHTELRLAGGRPVVLETHTRAGGDRIPLLHLLVGGRDQLALTVCAILGVAPPPAAAGRFAFAGVRFFRWPSGTLAGVDGLDAARAAEGVVEVELRARPGEHVRPWASSLDRPAHAVAGGATPGEVRRRLDRAERLLRPRYASSG